MNCNPGPRTDFVGPRTTMCDGCNGGRIKVEKESGNKYKVSCIPFAFGEEKPGQLNCNDDTVTSTEKPPDEGEYFVQYFNLFFEISTFVNSEGEKCPFKKLVCIKSCSFYT